MKFVSYIEKDSIIHRLDPRTKIAVVIVISLLSLFFNHPLIMFMLFCSVLLLSLVAKIGRQFLMRILPMTPVAVMAFILWTFFFQVSGSKVILFQFSFITVYQNSVLYAIAMVFRVLTVLGAPLLFFTTTTFSELTLALVKLKIPYVVAFTLALSLRFVDYGLGQMNTIKDAQASRGLKLKTKTMIENPQNIIALFGPLAEKFMGFQQYLAMSMDMRSFAASPKRTFYINFSMNNYDYLITALAAVLLLAGVLLKFNGFGGIV
jgi:energy-coupling factor transport system permease protein